MADEVDRDAPLSRLTLFSPCKVTMEFTHVKLWKWWVYPFCWVYMLSLLMQINVFLRITEKREDGYHDLASLFHVSIEMLLFDDIRCSCYSK